MNLGKHFVSCDFNCKNASCEAEVTRRESTKLGFAMLSSRSEESHAGLSKASLYSVLGRGLRGHWRF
jgi:hypothetical protein